MRFLRLTAAVLALLLLLTGCFPSDVFMMIGQLSDQDPGFSNEDMVYTRPDIAVLMDTIDAIHEAAQAQGNFEGLYNAVMAFDAAYSDFITNYHLSNLRYSADLKDTYWETEYNFCMESLPSIEQAMEKLYRALARCPYREELESDELFGEDFFDDYDGDLYYDDHFLSLTQQEAALESRYYALSDEADPNSPDYYDTTALEMAQLYVQMVQLRQQIAEYAGYESYAHYAYDTAYDRDYTPQQADAYLEEMGLALSPVLSDLYLAEDWGYSYEYCDDSVAFRYVRDTANAMGGTIAEAFSQLDKYHLYDIRYSKNKYNASFEVFLPSYGQPYIFMNPNLDQSDKLTFAHEFGHFANDYACGGSYCGIDVAEVHSQAFEYLSLCYGEGRQELANYKMVDSLFSYIQCAAHALFELRVYQLTGDELNVENVLALYGQITQAFGFGNWGWDSRNFVQITHFFTHPMYMVSYVVSNDLAMQIYQKELESHGAGLALYEKALLTNESGILRFAEDHGLQSPFTPGRPEAIAQLFRASFHRPKNEPGTSV